MYDGGVNASSLVIGYTRVSTTDQGESGAGLEVQRAAIAAECEKRGWVLERIEEDVLSGRTINRPGLQRALADCRDGKVAGIVAAKLDRLSRSLLDFATLLANARKRGYNVVALDLGLDLSTPSGKMMAGVMSTFAEYERDLISQRTKDALAVKRAQGVTLGRPRTMPDELRHRIRIMHVKGMSYSAIARTLTTEGTPTVHGGVRWYPSTIRAALS